MAELADEDKCPFFSIFSDLGASGGAKNRIPLTPVHSCGNLSLGLQ